MVTMSIKAPPRLEERDLIIREGPFTLAARDALPDDGYRHELLDGVLVMSPPPAGGTRTSSGRCSHCSNATPRGSTR